MSKPFSHPLSLREVGSEKVCSSLRVDWSLASQLGQLVGDVRSVFRYVELRQ